MDEYDGRQYVGIDLHRRRSVIVRMTPEGKRLGAAVRIVNSPFELAEALDAGWSLRRACQVLELPERRAHRWIGRRARGQLADLVPGGAPMHGLLEDEVAQILALFDQWGETDRSHRKLAHRGSYPRPVRMRSNGEPRRERRTDERN